MVENNLRLNNSKIAGVRQGWQLSAIKNNCLKLYKTMQNEKEVSFMDNDWSGK